MHTHDLSQQPSDAVLNQATALEDYDPYASDAPLRDALQREGGAWAEAEVQAFARQMGQVRWLEAGDLANRHEPRFVPYDRFGHRVDVVEFHPSYHDLMAVSVEAGLHSRPWTDATPGVHVARAAMSHFKHGVEQGTSCPVTMTFAVVPSLRLQPELAAAWEPKVLSRSYDPRFLPVAQKTGALFGMAMTERQGGSDVRANTTRAVADGAAFRLTGHKWFCSAPMCDAFLVLAQEDDVGLSCFLVPRFLPDGSLNVFRVQRLKEKVGNRSNASSEVFFDHTWAQRVGDAGRGVPTIIEMVRHTRLDCSLGAASLIRRCVAEAAHHVRGRWAFGRPLIEQPLMRNVLADLCLESEAATAMAFRLARAFDESHRGDEAAVTFGRLATPVTKYWTTKRETVVAREALECLGGNGFVEDAPLARLYRESPLNSVWEGAGNVQCLDMLRAAGRAPDSVAAFVAELEAARGQDRRYDGFVDRVKDTLADRAELEYRARRVTEDMALALQGALLVQHAPAAVADAFCASRLAGDRGGALGTLPVGLDLEAVIERSMPVA